MTERELSEAIKRDAPSMLHHWHKYHNPTAAGFMGGQFYLGVDCVNCPFSDAEREILAAHDASGDDRP